MVTQWGVHGILWEWRDTFWKRGKCPNSMEGFKGQIDYNYMEIHGDLSIATCEHRKVHQHENATEKHGNKIGIQQNGMKEWLAKKMRPNSGRNSVPIKSLTREKINDPAVHIPKTGGYNRFGWIGINLFPGRSLAMNNSTAIS